MTKLRVTVKELGSAHLVIETATETPLNSKSNVVRVVTLQSTVITKCTTCFNTEMPLIFSYSVFI